MPAAYAQAKNKEITKKMKGCGRHTSHGRDWLWLWLSQCHDHPRFTSIRWGDMGMLGRRDACRRAFAIAPCRALSAPWGFGYLHAGPPPKRGASRLTWRHGVLKLVLVRCVCLLLFKCVSTVVSLRCACLFVCFFVCLFLCPCVCDDGIGLHHIPMGEARSIIVRREHALSLARNTMLARKTTRSMATESSCIRK